jgi:hypothetical protein
MQLNLPVKQIEMKLILLSNVAIPAQLKNASFALDA